jgi:tetratricopeptide (TPR) repeat protein
MSGRRDQHEANARGRSEPTLSNSHLDALDSPVDDDDLPQVRAQWRRAGSRSKPVRAGRGGWLIPLLLLVLVGVFAALWLNQGRLRGMLPRTGFNDVLTRAQQALQSGRLDGQDGSSARELFQAAMALEPDNDRARDGLHQVGEAELAQADAAVQAGDLDRATRQAAQARELLGGGSDVDRLDQSINRARTTKVQTVDLVGQAQQALTAGTLDGEHGAGALYRRVLQSDPGNAVAAHGLDQVGDALAARAHTALDAGDSDTANASIEQLAALQPNNGALPALRAAQAQQRRQQSSALDATLAQGEAALRAGHISGAGDDTALAHFNAALALDPDNRQARAGLGKVAQALTVQANAALDAGDTAQAGQLLDQASTLAPKSADLAAARARLTGTPAPAASRAPADDDRVTSVTPALSPQQSAQLAGLLQRAQSALQRGDVMLPPGACAYDLYRSALAIDGNNAAALQGMQTLPAQVEREFKQALAHGQLASADAMLANLAELSPGDPAQTALGERLASAWLDQAEQQLANGDRVDAKRSLGYARKLAPTHPRVIDLGARLQDGP